MLINNHIRVSVNLSTHNRINPTTHEERALVYSIYQHRKTLKAATRWKIYTYDWRSNDVTLYEGFEHATRNELVNAYLVEGLEQLRRIAEGLERKGKLTLELLTAMFRDWLAKQERIN